MTLFTYPINVSTTEFARQMAVHLYEGTPEPEWTPGNDVRFRTIETRTPPDLKSIQRITHIGAQTDILRLRGRRIGYDTFRIPKRSGGTRVIEAPYPDLKNCQRELNKLWALALPHDSAFAYIPGRSTRHALQRHQENQSNFFLKLDLKDFFPSCDINWVHHMIKNIYPFNHMGRIEHFLEYCALNNRLPQGAPTSPVLSNLAMLPTDKIIAAYTAQQGMVYTRYADDILISSQYNFNFQRVVDKLEEILNYTPLKIKHEKTRYGSRAGRNWNLGLMLNKDNKITIGHKKKEVLRATLYNFLMDYKNGNPWDTDSTAALAGKLSYYESIEPSQCQELIRRYQDKTQINYAQAVKDIL